MTDTEVKIKVTADISQAQSEVKKLHKVATGVGSKALQQQQVQAGIQKKQQQQQPKTQRVQSQEIKRLQEQNKLIQAQNKLIQQNIRLSQQQGKTAATKVAWSTKVAKSFGITNQNGSVWSNGRGPGGGGPGGGGGRGGRGGGGGGGGTGMWIMGGIAGGIAAAVGALVNMVVSQIAPSDETFTNFAKAARPLRALSGGTGIRGIAQKGREFGFTELESIQQMRGVARATGSIGDLTTAQATARGMGMDVGEVSEYMGMLTRSGQGGKGAQGERALYRLMSSAMASGLDKSRAGEHLQAVSSLVQSAGGRLAGTVDAAGIGGLLAYFSKSGQAGLQGARGGAVLSQMDSVITGAGYGSSGDPIQALIMRAMGFGTGGNADLYTATGRAQQGIFGEKGAANLRAVVSQFETEYARAGDQGINRAMSESFHLSQDIIEQIREVIHRGGPDMDAEIAQLTQGERPVEDQILSVLDGTIDSRLETIIDTETQLLNQGERNSRALDDITNDVNRMAAAMWDAVVPILRIIADAVKIVANFVTSLFRGATAVDQARYKMEDAQGALRDVFAKSDDEGVRRNAMQVYRDQMERIHADLEYARVNPGAGTHLIDALSGNDGLARNRELVAAQERVRLHADTMEQKYRERVDAGVGMTQDFSYQPRGRDGQTIVVVPVERQPGGDPQVTRHTAVPQQTTR